MTKRITAAALAALLSLSCFLGGCSSKPKFRDVTVELGQTMPMLSEFLTENAKEKKAAFVTLPSETDLEQVGSYDVTLSHGRKQETVKLHVVDTTAPELTLQDLSVNIGTVLSVEDFVVDVSDLAEVTVALATPLSEPEGYGDTIVEVIATDASGNETKKSCTLSYVWMRTELALELGGTVTKSDILMDPEKDGGLLDQAALDALSTAAPGEYTVTATTVDGESCSCVITVTDTTAPTLKVKNQKIFTDETVTVEDFVTEAADLSGSVTTRLLQTPDFKTPGTYTVTVEAADPSGNITTAEATLEVVKDTTGPVFSGLSKISLDKGDTPNYTSGVTAKDDRDGKVEFSYDADSVNLSKPDTYYVVYTAKDKAGNTTTEKRKVIVLADTAAPKFSGLKDITVKKGQAPDYSSGVTAKDNWDGKVDFTYDDSKVNLSKAGTYYVTYTAKDQAGNKATGRRKVTVNHDEEDTKALVQEIAAGLSSDPEAIRDYVRNSIKYSSDWGNPDPVWFGFKNKKGNCYVHALCLQELLEVKGYNTKLIWVTDKSHYWLLIELNGTWKHIDATPGRRHTKYSLMNDAQRLETLQGRTWDTSNWPAAE